MGQSLTTIDRRGLARMSTPDGAILVVAADQRASMRAVMSADPAIAGRITDDELRAAKADLAAVLGGAVPAILFDSQVGLPAVIDDGSLPATCAAVVGLDASGFETDADGLRHTAYVPGMTPARARRIGGDAVKMLDYLRPDRQTAGSPAGRRLSALWADCQAEGLPLVVELLPYRLPEETDADYRAVFPSLVVGCARFGAACGATMLKLPYPGSADACDQVTRAAAGIPWAVLSAGADFDDYLAQVRLARKHGAAGAVGGRAIWKDALALDPAERRALLRERALPRVRALAEALSSHAKTNF